MTKENHTRNDIFIHFQVNVHGVQGKKVYRSNPTYSVGNRVYEAAAHLRWPVKTLTPLPQGGMDAGRGVVKGWPWGSGSHTNMVVALLNWKGGYGSP